MKEYLLRRMLALVPVMFVVATLVFVLMHLTPGDPVSAMLGMDASAVDIDRMRSRLDLDQPLFFQYVLWLGKVVRGNLGESIFLQVPVLTAVLERPSC
jgi:peptide/nickel transport system permease protein